MAGIINGIHVKNDNEPAIVMSIEESQDLRKELIVAKIREKYSLTDEFQILREAMAYGNTEQFQEYNDYIEECRKLIPPVERGDK